jgi:serine/threonine-protein kinase
MKHKGPIITLATGIVVAGVLLALDLGTAPAGDATSTALDRPAATASATATRPTDKVTAKPTPPSLGNATFAGEATGGRASVAVVVKNGTAIAYVCDGSTAEAWLSGPVTGDTITLTGKREDRLTATYANRKLTGQASAGGHTFSFSIGVATAPSGLYRAAANVRGARVVAGWIVLANGRQVGMIDNGTTEAGAPALDTAGLTSVIDGTSVTAAVVDGPPSPLDQ